MDEEDGRTNDIRADTKQDKHHVARPATPRWQRFWNTKIGLALLGFLLTAIGALSGRVWDAYTSYAARQRLQAERTANARTEEALRNRNLARELREKATGPTVRYFVQEQSMSDALGRKTSPEEMEQTWLAYLQARNDYQKFRIANEYPPERDISAVNSNADYLNGFRSVLWTYADLVIDAEFARIDDCLVSAHDAYAASGTSETGLSDCVKEKKKDGDASYFASSPWYRFKECVAAFSFQFDGNLQFRQQLAAEDPPSESDRPVEMKKCPGGYGGNAFCRQYRYQLSLWGKMQEACGPLPEQEGTAAMSTWRSGIP